MEIKRCLVALVCLALSACGSDSPTPTAPSAPTPPATPTVTGLSVAGNGCDGNTCTAPGPLQLAATASWSNGTTSTVTGLATWNSTNADVASVSSAGAVTPRAQGTADVMATYQGRTAGRTIIVPAPWSQSGSGDTVLDMPGYISRVRITGRYARNSSNFVVWIGGRLVVNELLGTAWNQVDFAGTYTTTGGTVEIKLSSGVDWSLTQVRQ